MRTLKDYVTNNLPDTNSALVITYDDTIDDIIKWLLTQENKETLISMINAINNDNIRIT